MRAAVHRLVPLRSLRVQMAIGGALMTTLTVALLFGIGYQLLDGHLRHELDRLIAGHYEEVRMRLDVDETELSSAQLEERLRESSDYSSGLFFIEVEAPGTGTKFRSGNLGNAAMPDVPGQRVFEGAIPEIGRLRIHEYLLPGMDVAIAMQLAPLEHTMHAYVVACLVLLLLSFAISLVTGWLLARVVLRPIAAISRTARRIGRHDLRSRIPVARVHAEMEDLIGLLNETFDRLEAVFDQTRRFADEASHELKTPLALIRLHAERLLGGGTLAPAGEEAVSDQLEEVTRLNRIIGDLLFLSRAEAGAVVLDRTEQDPVPFLETFAQDAAVLAAHYGCRFELALGGAGRVLIAPNWLRQLLLNLLTNAIGASPPGGLVRLVARFADGRWSAVMADEGRGLDAWQRERMFERFVRFPVAKEAERGTGLGLAISRKIAELHDGRLFARPAEHGTGLQVVLELDALPAPAATSARRHEADTAG